MVMKKSQDAMRDDADDDNDDEHCDDDMTPDFVYVLML